MFAYQTELELHNYLLENFNEYFPYKLIANEYELTKGRVDFLAEDNENIYVIELKKEFVNKATLNQLTTYMTILKEEFQNKNIVGIAIAPKRKNHINDMEIPKNIRIQLLDGVNYVGIVRATLTLEKTLKLQLEEEAKKQNRSFNNLVLKVLKDYVANK